MRISDWSSDVCSSDLNRQRIKAGGLRDRRRLRPGPQEFVHPIEASRASSPVTTESVSASIVLRKMSIRRATFFDVVAVISRKCILTTRKENSKYPQSREIGRAHDCTPDNKANLVCRLRI